MVWNASKARSTTPDPCRNSLRSKAVALAYASAIGLSRAGANRQLVLIDIVHRGETSLRPEKNSRRWETATDGSPNAGSMCRSRPSGSPSISTTTFRSGCTGHRQRSGAHRPGGMIELSALRPGDQRAVDTAEIARRRACQLSTAPTASSTTRSSSRPQSSTRRQRGEDVSGLEAVHLGGEHIRPSTSATSPRSAAHLGQRMD